MGNLHELDNRKASKLLEDAIAFAEKGLKYRTVHVSYVHYRASHSEEDIRVEFDDGMGSRGKGIIIVEQSGESVFRAFTSEEGNGKVLAKSKFTQGSRNYEISDYIPGNWEDKLSRL